MWNNELQEKLNAWFLKAMKGWKQEPLLALTDDPNREERKRKRTDDDRDDSKTKATSSASTSLAPTPNIDKPVASSSSSSSSWSEEQSESEEMKIYYVAQYEVPLFLRQDDTFHYDLPLKHLAAQTEAKSFLDIIKDAPLDNVDFGLLEEHMLQNKYDDLPASFAADCHHEVQHDALCGTEAVYLPGKNILAERE